MHQRISAISQPEAATAHSGFRQALQQHLPQRCQDRQSTACRPFPRPRRRSISEAVGTRGFSAPALCGSIQWVRSIRSWHQEPIRAGIDRDRPSCQGGRPFALHQQIEEIEKHLAPVGSPSMSAHLLLADLALGSARRGPSKDSLRAPNLRARASERQAPGASPVPSPQLSWRRNRRARCIDAGGRQTKRLQRESTVTGTCDLGGGKMKLAWECGSSRVFTGRLGVGRQHMHFRR